MQRAVAACVEALGSLYGPFGVSGDMVSSAKHTVLERISLQSQTNKFYLDALAGCQDDHLAGRKGFWREEDFRKVVESITVADVQAALAVLSLKPENMTVCVGTAGPDASSLLPR